MKVVYSYYCLDIVHSGHLLMMKNAKAIAGEDGKLIVGILTDEAVMEKKRKPTLSLRERMAIAGAIKYVDLVVSQDTYSPLNNVISIKPDILMESASHDEEDIKKLIKEIKAHELKTKIIQLPYYPLQSSSKIKKRIQIRRKKNNNPSGNIEEHDWGYKWK